MAKDDDDDDNLSPLAENAQKYLEDAKKGKPRSFLLVCKGNKVKFLAVKKKPAKKSDLGEAKKQGYKGDGFFDVSLVDSLWAKLDRCSTLAPCCRSNEIFRERTIAQMWLPLYNKLCPFEMRYWGSGVLYSRFCGANQTRTVPSQLADASRVPEESKAIA